MKFGCCVRKCCLLSDIWVWPLVFALHLLQMNAFAISLSKVNYYYGFVRNVLVSEITTLENKALKIQGAKSNNFMWCPHKGFLFFNTSEMLFFSYKNQYIWAVLDSLWIPAGGVNFSLNRCYYLKARVRSLSWIALALLEAVELHPLAPVLVLNTEFLLMLYFRKFYPSSNFE